MVNLFNLQKLEIKTRVNSSITVDGDLKVSQVQDRYSMGTEGRNREMLSVKAQGTPMFFDSAKILEGLIPKANV